AAGLSGGSRHRRRVRPACGDALVRTALGLQPAAAWQYAAAGCHRLHDRPGTGRASRLANRPDAAGRTARLDGLAGDAARRARLSDGLRPAVAGWLWFPAGTPGAASAQAHSILGSYHRPEPVPVSLHVLEFAGGRGEIGRAHV